MALAAHGFKRKSPHLLRECSDVLQCVHFQSSQWGTATEGRFTVNLVVTSSGIYEAWTGCSLPANPATASYPIQQRIGSCLPEKKDTWWTIDSEIDLDALAGQVAAIVALHAPAFFAQFTSTQAMLSSLRVSGSLPGLTRAQAALVHAYLAQVNGSAEEAQSIICTELRATSNSPFKNTILSFAERAHIQLPQ